MKNERFAPWIYTSAAILIFVGVIAAAAILTMAVASAPDQHTMEKTFHPQESQSTFLPFLSQGTQVETTTNDGSPGDSSLGIQELDEANNP